MSVKSIYSIKPSAAEAAADIKNQLEGFNVKMLVYFASREAFNPSEISAHMQAAFPQSDVFGCSSHAEINNSKTLFGSVTAMAFDSQTINDVKVEVLENINKGVDISPAFDSFEAYFKISMADAHYREFGGMILIDGISLKEEEIMDKIGNRTNIMFIGGSASDALKFESTYIYANGKAYTNAALLAVFKPNSGIDFLKTQSVTVTDTVLTITKADLEKRDVIEFDNVPAAIRYTQALGINPLDIEPVFFNNPVGLVIGSDVYVRSCRLSNGNIMTFNCNMPEGMKLNLLNIKDIIPDTRKAVEEKRRELKNIAGIIDFRCASRTIQLTRDGTLDEYGKIFEGIPTCGFSTFGEQFLGHMNQTSTMMIFK